MKKQFLAFFILPLWFFILMYSFSVQAAHHLVFVSTLLKFSSTDCAIELTISGNDQDAFVEEDDIRIDDETLATLTAVVDAGINDADGNNDDGDFILSGSVSFDESHGINVDLAFDDENCANLDEDATVAFFNNGTTEIDSIDTSDVEGFGGDNTAITKTSSGGTPSLVDLGDEEVTLTNNAGENVTLGEDDAEDDDEEGDVDDADEEDDDEESSSSSCSLNPETSQHNPLWNFALLGFGFIGLAFGRFDIFP